MIDRDMVLRFIDAIGPDRLIFGTDFPMWSPKEELNRFFSLGLSESDQAKDFVRKFHEIIGPERRRIKKRGNTHVSDRH